MVGGSDGKRIVDTRCGGFTGETLYRDEDGTWWTDNGPPLPYARVATNETTVARRAELDRRHGKIYPK